MNVEYSVVCSGMPWKLSLNPGQGVFVRDTQGIAFSGEPALDSARDSFDVDRRMRTCIARGDYTPIIALLDKKTVQTTHVLPTGLYVPVLSIIRFGDESLSVANWSQRVCRYVLSDSSRSYWEDGRFSNIHDLIYGRPISVDIESGDGSIEMRMNREIGPMYSHLDCSDKLITRIEWTS